MAGYFLCHGYGHRHYIATNCLLQISLRQGRYYAHSQRHRYYGVWWRYADIQKSAVHTMETFCAVLAFCPRFAHCPVWLSHQSPTKNAGRSFATANQCVATVGLGVVHTICCAGGVESVCGFPLFASYLGEFQAIWSEWNHDAVRARPSLVYATALAQVALARRARLASITFNEIPSQTSLLG